MSNFILAGHGRAITRLPQEVWKAKVKSGHKHTDPVLAFMSDDHHQVRNFVVRELPRLGKPIPPGTIAERLGLSQDRAIQILDDLEKNLFFLWRNLSGEVVWAYPVTVETTPHAITFKSGERLYAA